MIKAWINFKIVKIFQINKMIQQLQQVCKALNL